MACRGSGRVISNLGGTPSDVACPWCDGTGTRTPGIDAQARWREDGAGDEGATQSAGAEAGDTGDEVGADSEQLSRLRPCVQPFVHR
jgi:hypothetical protein